ncbi:phage tail assembly chaperone [Xanthomonas retroflexus]|uniref:phage tail assembly chaperone n=1 Tax=Stenotrophomonas indicatrix TaxID=2045451 RepID=UPI000B443365
MAKKEVQIGQTTFYLTTFAPREQLRIFGDLQKELLPSIGALLAAAAGKKGTVGGDWDETDLLGAIRSFSSSLDGKGLDAWCGRLIDSERVIYEKAGRDARKLTQSQMDDAFEDFAEILELLFEIIQLNFAGPFVHWLDRSGLGLSARLPNLSDSSPTASSTSS